MCVTYNYLKAAVSAWFPPAGSELLARYTSDLDLPSNIQL